VQDPIVEESLDPKDWDRFAVLAHQMVDTMISELRSVREGPVWQPVPESVRRTLLDEPVPLEPQGEEEAFKEFKRNVLPYRNGNISPRFHGWFMGNGTALGMMADMLASGLDAHLAGYAQAPVLVEQKVVEWFRELMGFPAAATMMSPPRR